MSEWIERSGDIELVRNELVDEEDGEDEASAGEVAEDAEDDDRLRPPSQLSAGAPIAFNANDAWNGVTVAASATVVAGRRQAGRGRGDGWRCLICAAARIVAIMCLFSGAPRRPPPMHTCTHQMRVYENLIRGAVTGLYFTLVQPWESGLDGGGPGRSCRADLFLPALSRLLLPTGPQMRCGGRIRRVAAAAAGMQHRSGVPGI